MFRALRQSNVASHLLAHMSMSTYWYLYLCLLLCKRLPQGNIQSGKRRASFTSAKYLKTYCEWLTNIFFDRTKITITLASQHRYGKLDYITILYKWQLNGFDKFPEGAMIRITKNPPWSVVKNPLWLELFSSHSWMLVHPPFGPHLQDHLFGNQTWLARLVQ